MAKLTPMKPPELEKICELMPTTSPRVLSSGPPELPRLIATSVWMKGTYCWLAYGLARPTALTMPAVTEWSKPNGEPIATTHWPGLERLRVADAQGRQALAVDLQQRDVGLLVAADHLGVELAAVGQAHRTVSAPSTTWWLVST